MIQRRNNSFWLMQIYLLYRSTIKVHIIYFFPCFHSYGPHSGPLWSLEHIWPLLNIFTPGLVFFLFFFQCLSIIIMIKCVDIDEQQITTNILTSLAPPPAFFCHTESNLFHCFFHTLFYISENKIQLQFTQYLIQIKRLVLREQKQREYLYCIWQGMRHSTIPAQRFSDLFAGPMVREFSRKFCPHIIQMQLNYYQILLHCVTDFLMIRIMSVTVVFSISSLVHKANPRRHFRGVF